MVQLTDQASISARSDGIGNAGDIRISGTDTLLLSSGSTVTTAASQASGGRITIVARTLLRLHDSAITASVQGGRDTVGGNITIDPEFVVLQNSQITANANEGQGGRIQLTAGVFLADPASSVTASSERGIDGEVNIQAPVSNLSGALRPLPPDFATATALFRDRCVARRREGTISTLVERGRDGVPAAPHGALPSRFPDWHPRSASTGVLPPSSHKTRLLRQSELQRDAAGQVRVSGWPAPIGVARLWTQECVNR
jgi:large exoprotein involved in heme utilization and adhesion